MQHTFRLRPSDSFFVGPTKITLLNIKSNRLVTLQVTDGATVTRVPLAFGTPFAPQPSVSIALDPNTSRASLNANLVVSGPDGLQIGSPE